MLVDLSKNINGCGEYPQSGWLQMTRMVGGVVSNSIRIYRLLTNSGEELGGSIVRGGWRESDGIRIGKVGSSTSLRPIGTSDNDESLTINTVIPYSVSWHITTIFATMFTTLDSKGLARLGIYPGIYLPTRNTWVDS